VSERKAAREKEEKEVGK
jgi:hypothetical protein